MALPGRTWRNPWLWPSTQAMVLLLPLLTAGRLAFSVESDLDAALASDLILKMTSIWAMSCALVLGAGPELFVPAASRADPEAKLAAVSRRMLAVLVVVPLSMAIADPPDVTNLAPAWRQLALLMATLVVPTWAGTLLARVRGMGPLRTIAVVPLWGVAVLGSTVVAGRFAFLDDGAILTAVAAAGVVGSIGLYLAATERVTASLGRVLVAVGVLAAALGSAVIGWMANPEAGVAWVLEPMVASSRTGEVFFSVQEPNLQPRIFSVQRTTGEVNRLRRGVWELELVGRWQVTALPSPALPFLPRTARLCKTRTGAEQVCVQASFPYSGTHVDKHGSLPLVLMVTRHAILVWNIESDEAWQVRRPEHVVRWPCFDDAGGVVWRLKTKEGPFLQERLVLDDLPSGSLRAPPEVSGVVERLPLKHLFQCRAPSRTPVGRLLRGRAAVGRPHVLHGPGLPDGKVELNPLLRGASWSKDGSTFMFGIDDDRIRFYRPEFGLSDPIVLPRLSAPSLSPNGALLAHYAGGSAAGHLLLVREVPGGAVVLETRTEASRTRWLDSEALLRVDAGRLIEMNARTGAETTLFPRPTAQPPVGP